MCTAGIGRRHPKLQRLQKGIHAAPSMGAAVREEPFAHSAQAELWDKGWLGASRGDAALRQTAHVGEQGFREWGHAAAPRAPTQAVGVGCPAVRA